MLTGGDGTEIPLALSESRSMFHVRAGVSRGRALGYQPHLGDCVPSPTLLCWAQSTSV